MANLRRPSPPSREYSKITYSDFCITPFSMGVLIYTIVTPRVSQLNGTNKSFPKPLILCSTHFGGIGVSFLLQEYIQISAQTLAQAPNDRSDLSNLTPSMLKQQLIRTHSHLPVPSLPVTLSPTSHAPAVPFAQSLYHGSYMRPNTCLDCFGTHRQLVDIRSAS